MQNFPRNHSRLIQTPLIHEGGIKKRHIKYFSVSVLIFFLAACATTPTVTQLPPMQPLTGYFTEERIDSEVKYGDDILVFHKTQGQMPISFVGVDKEILFFRDIDETQNLYSVMDGKIYLKDIDRIEGIKRSEIAADMPRRERGKFWGEWGSPGTEAVNAVGKTLTGILLFALLIALAG
jgi:hypothetical protein